MPLSNVLLGENDPLSLTKPSKESTRAATARRPLGDRTNGKLKSAVASVEGSRAPALQCVQSVLGSDQEYETVRLDSEGFVIWEDEDLAPASAEIDLADQVVQLQSALASTLEENRMLHAKLAVAECNFEELERTRDELETLYELYACAKQELDEMAAK